MWHVGEHIDRFSKACLGHNAYPGLSLMLTMINTARWARISPGVTHCHSGSTKPFPSCFCATYLLVSCDWRKVWGTKKKSTMRLQNSHLELKFTFLLCITFRCVRRAGHFILTPLNQSDGMRRYIWSETDQSQIWTINLWITSLTHYWQLLGPTIHMSRSWTLSCQAHSTWWKAAGHMVMATNITHTLGDFQFLAFSYAWNARGLNRV